MADFLSWDTIRYGADLLKYGVLVGGASSLATWYLTKRSYDNGEFRARIEVIGFEPELQPDGTYLVDFPTHGDQMNLSNLIGLPRLEKKMIAATRRTRDGFIVLDDPRSQKLMMGIIEDHLTGNDDRTHTEALDGVPTRRVDIVFAPTYFYEADEDVSMIRVLKISKKFIPLLADTGACHKFHARLARKEDLLQWAFSVAVMANAPAQQSSNTAFIWPTTLKASFGAAADGHQLQNAA